MKVLFSDVKSVNDTIASELDEAFQRVLRSGRFILGQEVESFETEFAAYCGVQHCIGVASGMDALQLSLLACGIGPGDEVITVSHTFTPTAFAIAAAGATPVFVDIDPQTYTLRPDQIEAAISERTRAILPVHLYGHCADMDAILEVAAQHKVDVIEDAAQAHGSQYKGRRAGSMGRLGCFSFYPTKNLGALGDAGALATNDAATADRVRTLANYGSHQKYRHDIIGRNSRLDPLQAAVLCAKLEQLDLWNARRGELALRYVAGLSDVRGLGLPAIRSWAHPVWHVYPVRAPGVRDELQAFLTARGVGTNIHYPTPVHLQPCYAGRWKEGDFPVAEGLAKSVLSLPLDQTHTPQEIDFVIAAVREFFGA